MRARLPGSHYRDRVRLALDGTPLLGRPTGIGRYVAGLTAGLGRQADPLDITLAAFTVRGVDVPAPPGTRWSGRRVPARALQACWERTQLPPVEWLSGRCDVFHATNFVLPPLRRARGVVSVHDLSFDRHPDTVDAQVLRYQRLVPRGLARAAVVLTLTEATAEEVRERFGLGDRVRAARPGVDPSWFGVPEGRRPGLPSGYALFVGSVEPRKNLPVLVEALRRMPDAPPLVLAGPAGWGPELDTSGIEVVRTGYLHDRELQQVVAGAAVLAFPSRHEGFGLPPLEALACGVPAVVSDLPVLREVLGQQAAYVPVGDADALADALQRVLADPGDAQARRAHAAQWTWDRCAAEARQAYDLALA
jgi:glycosyltransferase involved in cell wall biosynthesis